MCVMSPRWQRGGHEVNGEDSNFGGIHAEVTHFPQMEGAVCIQGTRRASDTVPRRRQMLLLLWVRPQYHQAQQFFCLVGSSLVRTTLPPHPLGSLELAVGPVHPYSLYSGYGDQSTWVCLDGLFYSHGAQLPLTPGFSGVGLASPPL